jgi:guanylate kinase
MPERLGLPIILTAPSGTGKTTLCRRVLPLFSDLTLSVSYTTRPPRAGETDGVDYHFVSEERFRERVAREELLEWAVVHGNLYGTGVEYRTQWIEKGRDVLFDVDVQGAARLAAIFPGAAKVFVLPPSFAALEARLRGRALDPPEVIERRLQNARREFLECRKYHHVIVNDDLAQAMDDFVSIIRAERIRTARMESAIARLLAEIGAG